jgi:serine/threonine-protein kinase
MSSREPDQGKTILLAATELGGAAAQPVGAPPARGVLATDMLPDDAVEPVSFRSLASLAQTAPAPTPEPSDAYITRTRFEERYVDRGPLGEGGMGEVRLARDAIVGREVAVKTMRPALEGLSRDRFLREARVQGQLEHPAVVPVYDLGLTDDRRLFFTMKRVRGESLEAILARLAAKHPPTHARYPLRKLLAAFVQLALAIEYAHRRGVVHRDLKPANVMLGDFGELHVLDWGLARLPGVSNTRVDAAAPTEDVTRGTTLDGSILGTPGYMAPEQVVGDMSALDGRADVYALGAILYEILSLEPLHGQSTLDEVLAATLAGPRPPLEARPSTAEVAPELLALVLRATTVSSHERLSSARELAEAVERYLDGEREEQRRRELVMAHVTKAQDLARASSTRTEALREVGRAVVLDPTNAAALALLNELFSSLPEDVPPEAATELEVIEQQRRLGMLRVVWVRAVAWAIAVPLFSLTGVKSRGRYVIVAALVVGNLGLATWLKSRTRASEGALQLSLGASTLCVTSFSLFYGPLVLAPVYAVTNALLYALGGGRALRLAAINCSIIALALPMLLSALGVEVAYYAQHGADALLIQSPTLEVPLGPTSALLLAAFVATTITPTMLVGRLTEQLDAAERRIALQAYHLRKLFRKS